MEVIIIKTYEHILFDLDGTLTDPKKGITKSVQFALLSFGIAENNLDNLEKFIGPPLLDSFMEYYNFTNEQARNAIDKYREYFSVTGLFENRVYDGIGELLTKLTQNNYLLYVATSKPTVFAKEILNHFKLSSYFESIVGSNLDGTRTNKAEVIDYCLKTNNLHNKDSIIMVGDRKHDILGAKKNGIHSIGVEYGFGSYDELKDAGATYIASDINELGCLLIKKR